MKFNLRQKLKMRCVKDNKTRRIHGCRFQQDLKIARVKGGRGWGGEIEPEKKK